MREGWTTKFLEELAEIGDGNHSGNYPKASEMVADGVPFIRGTNLIDGKVSPDDMRFISTEKHEILKKGHLKTGDILFTNRGQVGKKAIVDARFNGSNLNSQIAWFRCGEKINNRYLFYFLDSPLMLKFITSNTNGTALQQLTIRQIRKLAIVFPQLPEQQQIVAILDEAFEAIDQAKANIEKNIENAKELFQSKLNDIFSQKGEGWEEKILGKICLKITDGSHHSPKYLYPEKAPGLFPYVTSKNIRNNYMDFSKLQYVDIDFHQPNYARCAPELGDVLLTKDGAKTGNITINTLDEPFSLLSSVALIRPDRKKLNPSFLKFYVQSPLGFKSITGKMTGAAIKRIILKNIKTAKINMPKVELQKNYVSKFEA